MIYIYTKEEISTCYLLSVNHGKSLDVSGVWTSILIYRVALCTEKVLEGLQLLRKCFVRDQYARLGIVAQDRS